MTRGHLGTAAMQHLRYGKSDLQAWGETLAERVGKLRARTAVSRKLAVTMLAMWKSGESIKARAVNWSNQLLRSSQTFCYHKLPAGSGGPRIR